MSDLVGNPEDRFSHNEAQLNIDLMAAVNEGPVYRRTDKVHI